MWMICRNQANQHIRDATGCRCCLPSQRGRFSCCCDAPLSGFACLSVSEMPRHSLKNELAAADVQLMMLLCTLSKKRDGSERHRASRKWLPELANSVSTWERGGWLPSLQPYHAHPIVTASGTACTAMPQGPVAVAQLQGLNGLARYLQLRTHVNLRLLH